MRHHATRPLLLGLLFSVTCSCQDQEEDASQEEWSCVREQRMHHRLRIASPPHLSVLSGPFDVRVEYAHRILPGHDGPDALAKGFRIFVDGDLAAEQPFDPDAQRRVRGQFRGLFRVQVRRRIGTSNRQGQEHLKEQESVEWWDASETSFVVCDMWGFHGCVPAALRVDNLVPQMNQVLVAARDRGVLVIHAPSSGVEEMAPDYPIQRRRAKEGAQHCQASSCLSARLIHAGQSIDADSSKEPELPFKAGCDDGHGHEPPSWDDETHVQHKGIQIYPQDALSDSGREIVGLLKQEGIRHVVLMGVHANECLLKRPFGARQLTREGFNVVVARDLTDALYDPRDPPYVSHARGTKMMIEHIEAHVCGSALSRCFLKLYDDPEGGTWDDGHMI